jgi:hypothetical protein
MRCAFALFVVLSACIQIYIATCGICQYKPLFYHGIVLVSNARVDSSKYGV